MVSSSLELLNFRFLILNILSVSVGPLIRLERFSALRLKEKQRWRVIKHRLDIKTFSLPVAVNFLFTHISENGRRQNYTRRGTDNDDSCEYKINSLLALIFAINLCAALKYVMSDRNVVNLARTGESTWSHFYCILNLFEA